MDPRKFVVNIKNLGCREVRDFRSVRGSRRIARWHCHEDFVFISAIFHVDWILYATFKIKVRIKERRMDGVVVTEFNHRRGEIGSCIQTAKGLAPINVETGAEISQMITARFTPVGRILNILPEKGHFGFEKISQPEKDFLSLPRKLTIDYQPSPEVN